MHGPTGKIVNEWLEPGVGSTTSIPSAAAPPRPLLSEDEVKEAVRRWLAHQGFTVTVAMGHERGSTSTQGMLTGADGSSRPRGRLRRISSKATTSSVHWVNSFNEWMIGARPMPLPYQGIIDTGVWCDGFRPSPSGALAWSRSGWMLVVVRPPCAPSGSSRMSEGLTRFESFEFAQGNRLGWSVSFADCVDLACSEVVRRTAPKRPSAR